MGAKRKTRPTRMLHDAQALFALTNVLASVLSTSCSDAAHDAVDPAASRLSLGTAELTPGSSQSLSLDDNSNVNYSLTTNGYYQPMPLDPRGCWAPCTEQDIENWQAWRELWVTEFKLTIQNTSSRSTAITEYSTHLLCVSASGSGGAFSTPGYQEGSEANTGVIELRPGEQTTIPLTCGADRWDPAYTWTKDAYVTVVLTDESNAPWREGNSSDDPLDPWG